MARLKTKWNQADRKRKPEEIAGVIGFNLWVLAGESCLFLENEGFEPSAELISQRLGVSKKDVIEMDQRINGWDVSLDAPLTEDTSTARVEFLKLPSDSMEDKISQEELQAILRQHIAKFRKEMDPRELHIFNQRIFAEDPQTLAEIGKQFGISRERVRQIQKGIIAKLKDSFKQSLPDYAAYSESGAGAQHA